MQSTSNPHHRVMQDEAMQQKTTRDNQAQVPPIRVDEEATRVQELALPEECRRLFREFRGACMSSWVMHFETLREKKAVLDRLQEQGAQFLPAGK